jgi:hypothetical protein
LLKQIVEIDVKRSGKEQETEHPMQESLIEVDVLNEAGGLTCDAIPQLAQNQQREGHGQRNGHQADCHRQFDISVIEVAEPGRKADQHRDGLNQSHRKPEPLKDSPYTADAS